MPLFLFLIIIQLGVYKEQSHLCLILNNKELLCDNITKQELKKTEGIKLSKELDDNFKITYAEVYVAHTSGRRSNIFKLNSSIFTKEIKEYLSNKVIDNDMLVIDEIKLQSKTKNDPRDLEKKTFKIKKPEPVFTK